MAVCRFMVPLRLHARSLPSLAHAHAPTHHPRAGIKDKINVFHFERDTLARAGINDSGTPTPPFLVIASNDINEELNSGEGKGEEGEGGGPLESRNILMEGKGRVKREEEMSA